MIKNFKDIVILLITSGVLILLGVIIVGDYWVALEENGFKEYREFIELLPIKEIQKIQD